MATSNQSFNQVKSILGKLDRSIDEARARRVHGVRPQAEPSLDPIDQPIGRAEEPDEAPKAPASKYGRAKPLRPTGDAGW